MKFCGWQSLYAKNGRRVRGTFDQFPGLSQFFLNRIVSRRSGYGQQAAGGARPRNQPRPRPFNSPNPFEFGTNNPPRGPMPFSLSTPTGLHAIPLTGKIIHSSIQGVLKNLYFPTLMFERIIRTGKFMLSIAFSQSKILRYNLSRT